MNNQMINLQMQGSRWGAYIHFKNAYFITKSYVWPLVRIVSQRQILSDHFLQSSHRDYSNKLANTGFGEEMSQAVSIEFILMHLIWNSSYGKFLYGQVVAKCSKIIPELSAILPGCIQQPPVLTSLLIIFISIYLYNMYVQFL